MKFKIVSLFSGIGAYEKALENIGVETEVIKYCELDAIKSRAYSVLHNVSEDLNMVDVTKIDTTTIADFDLLVWSPPCQSFSMAGKRLGIEDSRGGLFYNGLKVLEDKQPTYSVMENVANLPNAFPEVFQDMLKGLDEAGYNSYWKNINASEFIPQNRNRVFLVSVLKTADTGKFEFPVGTDNRHWSEVIDPYATREITPSQRKKIDIAKGITENTGLRIEGKPQFEDAVIATRQSGLRFQNNRTHPTIMAAYGAGGANFSILAWKGHIGGITPRGCFLLMGFDKSDNDILDLHKFSMTSQYRMAGDSVCVPVLEHIFTNLIDSQDLKIENDTADTDKVLANVIGGI